MSEKRSENNRRESLFQYLNDVLALAHKKITIPRGNSDKAKQGWARVLVSAVCAYGSLLKDADLDQLRMEIEQIKEKIECRQILLQ